MNQSPAPWAARPRSLYVHVPFCRNKCGYCDFYSLAAGDEQLMRRYVAAVALEAERSQTLLHDSGDGQAAPMKTIYIGGGTPSILPPELLEQLLRVVSGLARGPGPEEFTVEANPGSLDAEKAQLLLRSGVNRLSLGIQSLNEHTLAVLGRQCAPQTARETFGLARRVGFSNISIDLIFAVPGQTLEQWQEDLEAALSLESEHLSVYGLSIEPETPLGRAEKAGRVPTVEEDLYVEMMLTARERLRQAGYEHYEISNYALPGRRSRHNMTYWRNEPYLGLGPAAASYVDGERRKNVSNVEAYCEGLERGGDIVAERERLTDEMAARETAMLALRLTEGLGLKWFRRRTGFDALELFADALARHEASGLVEIDPTHIRLSEAALPVADSVLADFIN